MNNKILVWIFVILISIISVFAGDIIESRGAIDFAKDTNVLNTNDYYIDNGVIAVDSSGYNFEKDYQFVDTEICRQWDFEMINGTKVDTTCANWDTQQTLVKTVLANLEFKGCIDGQWYRIYRHPDFVTNKQQIIEEGQQFKDVQCSNNKLRFAVESFSSYTSEQINALKAGNTLYYSFNNEDLSSGNPLDLSSTGNNGTTTGATTNQTGISGEAFSYDGLNDYVFSDSSSDFNYNDDFSLCIWANRDANGEWMEMISTNDANSPFRGWTLSWEASDKVRFKLWSTTVLRYTVDTTNTYTGTDWSFWCAVYNGTSGSATIYYNGSAVPTTNVHNALGANNPASGQPVHIGSRPNPALDGTYEFDGLLDEAMVYSRMLNSTEIETIYNITFEGLNIYDPISVQNATIKAYDIFDFSAISTFNATVNGTLYQTTNGTITLPYLSNQSNITNITIVAAGYVEKNYTNYNISNGLSAELTPFNILEVFVYDTDSNPITQNVTLDVQTDSDEITYTIQNASRVIRNISDSTNYRLVFNSVGYEEKIYEYVAPDSFYNSLNIYLVNASTSDLGNVTFQISDSQDVALSGVAITIEVLVNGTYTVINNKLTDVTGTSTTVLDTSKRHRITLSKTGYETQVFFINEPLNSFYEFQLSTATSISFETAISGVTYDYTPQAETIFNRSYNVSFNVASTSDLDYFGTYITVKNAAGATVINFFNISMNENGGTVIDEIALGDYVNGTLEIYYCFKKDDFNENCIFKEYIIEEYVDTQNLFFVKQYAEDNMTLGERLTYWIMGIVIVGLILVLIPFMRGAFLIIPMGIFSLFLGWLFLPTASIAAIGFFSFIGVLYLTSRSAI